MSLKCGRFESVLAGNYYCRSWSGCHRRIIACNFGTCIQQFEHFTGRTNIFIRRGPGVVATSRDYGACLCSRLVDSAGCRSKQISFQYFYLDRFLADCSPTVDRYNAEYVIWIPFCLSIATTDMSVAKYIYLKAIFAKYFTSLVQTRLRRVSYLIFYLWFAYVQCRQICNGGFGVTGRIMWTNAADA